MYMYMHIHAYLGKIRVEYIKNAIKKGHYL